MSKIVLDARNPRPQDFQILEVTKLKFQIITRTIHSIE